MKMTASVFMAPASVSIVAKKVRAWRFFGTNTGELRGCGRRAPRRSAARKAISVLCRRYTEMPQERPPHAFVVAEAGAFGHLHDTAYLPAFEQQPRGFHPQRLDAARRRHAGAAGVSTGEGPRRHPGLFSERFDLEIACDVFDDPGVQCTKTPFDVGGLRREHGGELTLAARPLQKHHQSSRNVERGGMAEVLLDHGKCQVDAGADTSR